MSLPWLGVFKYLIQCHCTGWRHLNVYIIKWFITGVSRVTRGLTTETRAITPDQHQIVSPVPRDRVSQSPPSRAISTDQVRVLSPVEALRPSSSRSMIQTQKTTGGRGKAGVYNPTALKSKDKFEKLSGSGSDTSSETIREQWKKWTEAHILRVKKDVARYIRQGTCNIVCTTCRKSVATEKWLKHRTLYNYCKPGDRYLKFSNYKEDYPNINIEL